MCLLGSVVIVLHAPPDQPVETIDQILSYALTPGTFHTIDVVISIADGNRIPSVLLGRGHILHSHDLSRRTGTRKKEPSDFHFDLLNRRLNISHVHQSVRNCIEVDPGRK